MSELPVFKITCNRDADPHPYLGRVIYTTDPGRALISGKCVDVGSIVMQQIRGLAARAPYFANGSAKTLREVVDFYDRRFDMKLTRPGEGRPDHVPGSTLMRPDLMLVASCSGIAGQQRSFVACPIVRDTKTVPCFLAEYEGEMYYLGIQQDISTPFTHPS